MTETPESTIATSPLDEPARPYTGTNRMIDMVWDLGERMTVGSRPEPRTVVAVLNVRHRRGGYVASLDREERGDRSRIVVIGGPHYVPGVTILTEPCNRFSAKAIATFAEKALAELRTMVDDPRVGALFTYTPGGSTS